MYLRRLRHLIKMLSRWVVSVEASNQDIVYVGRVRKDISRANSISLWCCGDQIRKGAASNAVSIMTYLEQKR